MSGHTVQPMAAVEVDQSTAEITGLEPKQDLTGQIPEPSPVEQADIMDSGDSKDPKDSQLSEEYAPERPVEQPGDSTSAIGDAVDLYARGLSEEHKEDLPIHADNGLSGDGETTQEVSGTLANTRVSIRAKIPTEKGLAYQTDIKVKRLRSTLQQHRHRCQAVEEVLHYKNYDLMTLYEARVSLEDGINEVTTAFHELGNVSLNTQNEFGGKFEECTMYNRNTLSRITESLRALENTRQGTPPDHHSVRSSHKGKSRSGSSCSSRQSSSSATSRKLDAAAKAAALRAKLQYHDAEKEYVAQLEKLSLMRDLAVEEAKFKVMSELESGGSLKKEPSYQGSSQRASDFHPLLVSNATDVQYNQISLYGPKSKSVINGPVSHGLVHGPKANSVINGPVSHGLVHGPKANSVINGPVSHGLVHGPKANSVVNGPVSHGLVHGPKSGGVGKGPEPHVLVRGLNANRVGNGPGSSSLVHDPQANSAVGGPAVGGMDNGPKVKGVVNGPVARDMVNGSKSKGIVDGPISTGLVQGLPPNIGVNHPGPGGLVHSLSSNRVVDGSPVNDPFEGPMSCDLPSGSNPYTLINDPFPSRNLHFDNGRQGYGNLASGGSYGNMPNNVSECTAWGTKNKVSPEQEVSTQSKTCYEAETLNPQVSNTVTTEVLTDLDYNAPVLVPSTHRAMYQTIPVADKSYTDIQSLVHSFSNMCNVNRLPVPEPGVFQGDALEYPSWRSAFGTLIEGRNIPPAERIHYLKRYLGGRAKDCVQGYLMMPTVDSYHEAMALIEKRFGNQFIVAQAFKSRIESWPKLSARDALGLRAFSDFLGQCEVAARSNLSLRVLDDDTQNHMILTKLPDWLVARWSRLVYAINEQQQRYPNFKEFVNFLNREADIACNPVTMLQSHKPASATQPDVQSRVGLERTGRTLNTNRPTEKCVFCEMGNHTLENCFKFKERSMEDKKSFIMDKRLCFGCLKPGHIAKRCKFRSKCSICSRHHPTPLHGDVREDKAKDTLVCEKQFLDQSDETQSKGHITLLSSKAAAGKSAMILPVYVSHESDIHNEVLVYALLDTQSDTSFVSDATCDRLGITGTDTTLKLTTMTDESGILHSQRIGGLSVRGFNSCTKLHLPTLYTHESIPACRETIPTPEMAKCWPHLANIANELMPKTDCDIGLLLGYNCPRALTPCDVIPSEEDGPFAQKTVLGWKMVGTSYADTRDERYRVHVCSDVSGVHLALRTSAKEMVLPFSQVGVKGTRHDTFERGLSREDRRFLALMEKEVHKTQDGHYEMPLPFRDPSKVMANNKPLATQRLKSLVKRFKKDPEYHNYYVKFMDDLLANEYAEVVPEEELKPGVPAYYLPHHGLYSAAKPGKIRVVMDGSATFMGESLNSNLLTGPDLINGLVGVLCRFRQGYVAFTCDIKGMFQQFRVNQEHRNFLRFLWFAEGDFNGDAVVLRSRVHLFGAVCSPAIANFGLRKAAQDGREEYGKDVVEFIHNNFYVDDGLQSLDSEVEAIDLINNSKKLCRDGGLTLHKFTSNATTVLESLAPEERSDNTKDLDLRHDILPIERALGIRWCMESDHFKFRVVMDNKPFTRRGVLSTVSSIFDPLGLISPVILVGKILLQEMCKCHLGWDEELPENLQVKWRRWLEGLPSLELLSIPRCFKPPQFTDITRAELHHFSDACMTGYGVTSYLRLVNEANKVHCSLVLSKSRVAPLKITTIPRLELTAAVLSTEVSQLLQKELQYDLYHHFWTDSKIVLGFVNSEARRFHVYVANRVQTIREVSTPQQWHYVDTSKNPADIASRGATGEQLKNSSWVTGPEFLWRNDFYSGGEVFDLDNTNPELRRVTCLATTDQVSHLAFPVKYSSWNRAKRVLAFCLRFIDNMKRQPNERISLQVDDMTKAEEILIKQAQRKEFTEEISALVSQVPVSRNSKLKLLDIFIDDQGIIRVGGRLKQGAITYDVKHPVVLPKINAISDLIIRHCHEKSAHQGRGITTNTVRDQGYWIMGLSGRVSSLVHKCVTCRRLRATCQQQKMGELPQDRIEPGPVFSYVAVDYFGPFRICEGRREVKRYAALFTCLNSRAVHVEVTKSLDTDAFINALRRMMSVRGPMRILRSDRGTNLIGGYKELKEAISAVDEQTIREFLLKHSCDYVVNPPHASHQGGVWERQIRTMRSVFNGLIGSSGHLLDDDGFRTFMSEAVHIVNSRPLTVTSLNDPDSLQPLTPNHLLTMKSNVVLPPPGVFQQADAYSRKRWKRVQYLLDTFWSRWKKEVLNLWQTRQKWHKVTKNLKVGDIVLVVDEQLPRCHWRLGRIVEVFPGSDSLVRKVKVLLGDPGLSVKGVRSKNPTVLERPIQKLILLYESD